MNELIQNPGDAAPTIHSREPYCEFAIMCDTKSIQFRGTERWVNDRLSEFSEQIMVIRAEQLTRRNNSANGHVDHHRVESSQTNDETRTIKGFDIPQSVRDEVFDLDGERVEIILPDLPGGSKKEKTHSAYLLVGLGALLKNGEPNFTDDTARSLCQTYAALDPGNHATYLKDLRDCILGSKTEGWRLSKPGIKRALEIAAAGLELKVQ